MKILLEKNEKLKCIQDSMSNEESIDIVEFDMLEENIDLRYDLLIIYCDSIEDIDKYKNMNMGNVLMVTSNMNTKFLYSAIMILHPLDIIGTSLSQQSIHVRITSNIEFLKEDKV